MLIRSAAVVLVVALGSACGGRTSAPPAAAADTAGAEAAALLTPADYEGLMKKVGPTNQELRMALSEHNLTDAAGQAVELGNLFGEVERFWAQQDRGDALKWAQQARSAASRAAGAAAGGDGATAQQAADSMLGACKQCHGTYRVTDPNGGFRIKPWTTTP